MDDKDRQPSGDTPLTQDREGPLGNRGWHGGATFFEESGGGDGHLPASESGTGLIPEDEGGDAADVHKPASESDTGALTEEDDHPPISWPGGGGPGTIPPPG